MNAELNSVSILVSHVAHDKLHPRCRICSKHPSTYTCAQPRNFNSTNSHCSTGSNHQLISLGRLTHSGLVRLRKLSATANNIYCPSAFSNDCAAINLLRVTSYDHGNYNILRIKSTHGAQNPKITTRTTNSIDLAASNFRSNQYLHAASSIDSASGKGVSTGGSIGLEAS